MEAEDSAAEAQAPAADSVPTVGEDQGDESEEG
jgi:hypothetical protein